MARTNVPCPHEQLIGLLEGMFVGDEVLLDVSFTAARARLADLIRGGLLLSASEDVYGQGITGLGQVGPAGLSRLVQVQTRELGERDGRAGIAIRWAVTGLGGGLFPVLDADIMLAPAGPRSTLLTLSGAYRPPLGSVGEAPDRAILHRVAAATIRSFISRLAAGITGHPGPAGTRAADGVPSPLPPAPEMP
jgi:hypothetical protein